MHAHREFSRSQLGPPAEERAAQARLEFWKTARHLRTTIQATRDLHAQQRLVLESARLQSLISEYMRKRRAHERRTHLVRDGRSTALEAFVAAPSSGVERSA
jgi:hypothetical protein